MLACPFDCVPGCAGCRTGYRECHTGVAIQRDGHRVGEACGGDGGKSLYVLQQFYEEGSRARGGIPVPHRIERNQKHVPGIEPFLNSNGALDAKAHISREQQQSERRSHLAQHQRVAQAQAAVLAQPDIAAFLQRRGQAGPG